jgi:hypothetical protein
MISIIIVLLWLVLEGIFFFTKILPQQLAGVAKTEASYEPQIPRNNQLIFFGCSYAFGHELNYKESLQSIVNSASQTYKKCNAYSYSIPNGNLNRQLGYYLISKLQLNNGE